jgi:WD40 repeat protein
MTGHTGAATSLSWRADGGLLASGSADSTIRLWNRDGTEDAVLEGHDKALARVEWHPEIDSKLLASSAYDHKVRLWRDGSEHALLEGHKDRVFGLTWSHDGTTLASGGGFKDAEIRLWNRKGDSIEVLKGHTSSIYQLLWRHQGDILASSSFDSTVRLWRDNEEIAVLEGLKGPALDIEWSPDGQFIASAATGSFGIWNLQQE